MILTVMETASRNCVCKCHLGGAASCPGCKENHSDGCNCENC